MDGLIALALSKNYTDEHGGSEVQVAATGTSTNDVRYITIDGTESRFASVALRAMKNDWKGSALTTAQAATAILNDTGVIEGDGFLGTVYWSDLPIPQGAGHQAEVKAFVLKKDTNHKIIQFECTSGTTAPYAWFFNSYEGKWRSYFDFTGITGYNATAVQTLKHNASGQLYWD